MSEQVTLNYEKVEWTYVRSGQSNNSDTFNFSFEPAGSTEPQEQFDPDFSAGDATSETDIAIEELTIAHEHIERPHDKDVPLFEDFFV